MLWTGMVATVNPTDGGGAPSWDKVTESVISLGFLGLATYIYSQDHGSVLVVAIITSLGAFWFGTHSATNAIQKKISLGTSVNGTTGEPLDPSRKSIIEFYPLPQLPTDGKTSFSSDTISLLIQAQGVAADKIELTDGTYITYSLSVWREFAKLDYIQYRTFQTEKFDCDKYADVMNSVRAEVLGNSPFGMIHVKRPSRGDLHALNFLIDSEGVFYYFEPQTGEIINPQLVDYQPFWAYI